MLRYLVSKFDAIEFHNSSCKLVEGEFALSVQICIGFLAGFSLVYKHYVIENPRRNFDIWILDISKQGFQSTLIHFWNIFQSIILSNFATKQDNNKIYDECANYFVTFVLDTLLGVYLVYILLKGVQKLSVRYQLMSLKHQGFYG